VAVARWLKLFWQSLPLPALAIVHALQPRPLHGTPSAAYVRSKMQHLKKGHFNAQQHISWPRVLHLRL
jgi:hypothetical protein